MSGQQQSPGWRLNKEQFAFFKEAMSSAFVSFDDLFGRAPIEDQRSLAAHWWKVFLPVAQELAKHAQAALELAARDWVDGARDAFTTARDAEFSPQLNKAIEAFGTLEEIIEQADNGTDEAFLAAMRLAVTLSEPVAA